MFFTVFFTPFCFGSLSVFHCSDNYLGTNLSNFDILKDAKV